MSTDHLVLKRATDHRAGREDYDVLNVGRVVGRIYETVRASREVAWFWSIFYEHRKPGRLYKGYAVDREGAMKEFSEAWRRETPGGRTANCFPYRGHLACYRFRTLKIRA